MPSSTATAWISPSTRTSVIENLVSGVDRYNPSNVGILEDYLYQQIRSQEYDCLANLAILKLYQFNPDLYNPDVVVNILLKALTAAPLPDFSHCLSLFDERPPAPKSEDPLPDLIPSLSTMHTLLIQCRFPAFWTLYHSEQLEPLRENYTIEYVGFEDAIREVVVRAVKTSFTKISSERLGSYLNLRGAELEAFAEQHEWTFDASAGIFTIPANPDNEIESIVVQEQIELKQLTNIIAHTTLKR
ncbi:hypothetical protein SERLA73DRAFT_167421 [Serpula lacrymans var. lacrymans S7.3]|uniref:Eukaryotic translation initiation factor 3 subunit K n=1 Tax=Serpula lacrymans var. lacrymans (strain S7.3) TaxID=936435 RepID=F8PSI7_SERL3|nr:hypothetical protein SERLA73DRAFT_167421 [Serpula lacrymans var. lacrymans S7.3]